MTHQTLFSDRRLRLLDLFCGAGGAMSVSGHVSPIKLAREAMGIDWTTRDELAEAIPPAYTKYIGIELLVQRELVEGVAA